MESLQSFENPAQPRPEAAVISSAGVTDGYGLVFLTILISEGMETSSETAQWVPVTSEAKCCPFGHLAMVG